MKIYKNGELCDIETLVSRYKEQLTEKIVVLTTDDHLHHIGAYVAWQSVGGRVQIINPMLTDVQKDHLVAKAQESQYNNCVFMHTSGTTGFPKLVVHTSKQFHQASKLNASHFRWNKETHFLSLFPASTSAFWQIVLAPTIYFDSTITISNLNCLQQDLHTLGSRSCVTGMIPAIVDYFITNKIYLNLTTVEVIATGGAQVQHRHVDYLDNAGCSNVLHVFGSTETTSLLFARRVNNCNNPEWTTMKSPGDVEVALEAGELWVRGDSVCENYKEFSHSEDWFRTGDIWEEEDGLIKFLGRKDDFVKINGTNVNLLDVESTAEEFKLGSVSAYKSKRGSIEFLILEYTNKSINPLAASQLLRSKLSKQLLPRKLIQVDDVARSALGKKKRIN